MKQLVLLMKRAKHEWKKDQLQVVFNVSKCVGTAIRRETSCMTWLLIIVKHPQFFPKGRCYTFLWGKKPLLEQIHYVPVVTHLWAAPSPQMKLSLPQISWCFNLDLCDKLELFCSLLSPLVFVHASTYPPLVFTLFLFSSSFHQIFSFAFT